LIETESKPRITSYGGREITISDIRGEDQKRVLAAFNSGAYWVRVRDGNLEFCESWEPLPEPTQDEEMLPFWRKPTEEESKRLQMSLFEIENPLDDHSSYSISIQHLCAYDYSADSYSYNAEKLESYGFICMRSKRGLYAKFWEIWFLPGLWCAEGDLKDHIGSLKGKQALKSATSFLSLNVRFGTLDVSTQRLAACVD